MRKRGKKLKSKSLLHFYFFKDKAYVAQAFLKLTIYLRPLAYLVSV